MSEAASYKGRCFCGAVELEVTGSPALMGFCHCASCRSWSAAPVNAFTLWDPQAVRVTKGAENLGEFSLTPNSVRKWCRTCGGHVLTDHPAMGLVDVYSAVVKDLEFVPQLHVFYSETVLPTSDSLPKYLDLPQDAGGTGRTVGA